MKKIMTLAAVAILMAACNNETEGLDNTSKYITVDANVAGESRVASKDALPMAIRFVSMLGLEVLRLCLIRM